MSLQKSKEVNGCGVWVWKWFIRAPYAKFFEADCCLHDELYTEGGSAAERHKADRRFFALMAKRASEERPVRAWWLATVALFYYGMVRVFGRFYWNYKQ